MLYDQLLRSLQSGQQDYSDLTNRLASGKKILSPSDDVTGAARALDYRVSINAAGQYGRNINNAASELNMTSTVLSSVSAAITQLKGSANTNVGGSGNQGVRDAAAKVITQLRDHLYGLANTKVNGRYLFSGFQTDTQSFNLVAGAYLYQGDSGALAVPTGDGSTMQANVLGSDAFSYTLAAPVVKQTASGLNVHYTPGAGTTVNVEIRDAADTAVLDAFSFSNVMDMANLLGTAVSSNNTSRIEALVDPFDAMQRRVTTIQSDVGSRLSSLQDQASMLSSNTNTLKNTLSAIEDADMNETAVQLQKTDTALQALRTSAAKVLSESLLDFLK
jgi:flagellar hook-associated protein 3 FlgL